MVKFIKILSLYTANTVIQKQSRCYRLRLAKKAYNIDEKVHYHNHKNTPLDA